MDSIISIKDLRKTCATYYVELLPESSIEILGHPVGESLTATTPTAHPGFQDDHDAASAIRLRCDGAGV